MSKRAAISLFLFCSIISGLCFRLFTLCVKADTVQYTLSHYKTVTIDYLRLPFYDCNGEKLCNISQESFLAVKPVIGSLPIIREALSKSDFLSVADTISGGSPAYAHISYEKNINNLNVVTLKKFIRYDDDSFIHLLGYIDNENNGVDGIEKSFNSFLKTDIPLYASFSCGADGSIIEGEKIKTQTLYYSSKGGLYLTVDKDIQRISEEALKNSDIKKGAVLIVDSSNGQIRAMASVPAFSRNNVAVSLNDKNSPLINRALCSYPVGSVFKVAVSVSALENGISPDYSIKCTGSITVDGKIFHCNKSKAHGVVNMKSALECSCNCYFIKLSQLIGSKNVLETASVLDYGKSTEIAKDIKSSSGNLPSSDELESSGSSALFSFGQGNFTANAVQISNMFSAVANSGKYYSPYAVIKGVDADGKEVYRYYPKSPVHVMKKETADLLKYMLISVVENGTAKNAYTPVVISGGKTATAQTGIYNNKQEKLITWFGGFFPADEPEYTVVILSEDGTTGGEDCAPVFRVIAENITKSKKEQ